jgi:SAM-dependent methyltransferase
LTNQRHLLPTAGAALDVACGRGRHALWLAALGFRVVAIDRDDAALQDLVAETRRRGVHARVLDPAGLVPMPDPNVPSLVAAAVDLETGARVLPIGAFDVIVAVHYLHRPLFPQLIDALRPGGVLVYETFTTAQAARGKPTNPDFLLRPGELLQLIRPLSVLASREGEFDGRDVASVVARKP